MCIRDRGTTPKAVLKSKSRFHFCLSLKAGNGGAPHGDTSPRGSRRVLSGRTLRGGLQTGFQPVACSLCADGVRRYSARINAFILLPLYYSGAVQGSQGGTKNDSECPPRCSGHPQRKNYFKFRDIGTPVGVPISHFTREKGPRSVRRRSGGRNYKSSFR